MVHKSLVSLGPRKIIFFLLIASVCARPQQPTEPVDPTPQDGESYALMDQATGMQLTGNASGLAGSDVLESPRDLGSLAQRWDLTRLDGGAFKLTDEATGLCLTENFFSRKIQTAQCAPSLLESWLITEGPNGTRRYEML